MLARFMEPKYFRDTKMLIATLLSSRLYYRKHVLEILENFSDYIERFNSDIKQTNLLFQVLLGLELPDRLLKLNLKKIFLTQESLTLLLPHSSSIKEIKFGFLNIYQIKFPNLIKLEMLMECHKFSIKEIDDFTLSHRNLEELDLSNGYLERLIDFNQFTRLRVLKLSIIKIGQAFDRFRFSDTLTHLSLLIDISGKIDFNRLPPALNFLEISISSEYEIDLTNLPRNLETLMLYHNSYAQLGDLTQLPERLECLILLDNNFRGELNLTRLPRGLKVLELLNNCFSGLSEGRLDYLPQTLKRLVLNKRFITNLELIKLKRKIKRVKITRKRGDD